MTTTATPAPRFVEFHPGYRVSDGGRVQSLRGGRWRDIRPGRRGKGYLVAEVGSPAGRVRRCVHHLVLEAFAGPRPFPGAVARHLDGDRGNNAASNLRWGTLSENVRDAIRHGTHGVTRLTPEQAREIRESAEPGPVVAARYGISRGYVSGIRRGRNWAWA
jgi:hypothetical protein